MALITQPPMAAPEEMPRDEMEPASRSVVNRLNAISKLIWVGFTLLGMAYGAARIWFAADGIDRTYFQNSTAITACAVAFGFGVVGCLVGYLASVGFDWARQVLVLLDRMAKR